MANVDAGELAKSLGIDFDKLTLKQKSDLATLFRGEVKQHNESLKEEKEEIHSAIWGACGEALLANFLGVKGYSYNGTVKVGDEERKLQVIIRWPAVAKKKDSNGDDSE